MEKKMTKMEILTALEELVETCVNSEAAIMEIDQDLYENFTNYFTKQKEQLVKKAEKAKEKAMSKQAEGDALRAEVYNVLTEDYQTIAEILAKLDNEDLTRAKVVTRLSQLVKAGMAEKSCEKTEDGKKVMCYRLAMDNVEM